MPTQPPRAPVPVKVVDTDTRDAEALQLAARLVQHATHSIGDGQQKAAIFQATDKVLDGRTGVAAPEDALKVLPGLLDPGSALPSRAHHALRVSLDEPCAVVCTIAAVDGWRGGVSHRTRELSARKHLGRVSRA